MRIIPYILLIFTSLPLFSFKPSVEIVYPQYRQEMIVVDQLENYLQSLFTDAENGLQLESSHKSALAEHRNYKHYYKGTEVLFSGLSIHIYKDGKVLLQNFLDHVNQDLIPEQGESCIHTNEGWLLVTKTYIDEIKRPRYEYRDHMERVLYAQEHYRYFGDSTVKSRVFQVNPTNSARTTYGGSYKDNGDQNSDSLQAQLYQVNTHAVYRNDSFYLEHPYFEFKELSWPYYYDNYANASDTFFYNRSEERFEAVNAFHHLVEYHSYLQALGYDNLALKVYLDVHALGGSDNSQFDPDAYTIEYGDGGVDDAEDTEVVIHEYVHSLSTTASNTFPNSPQRNAMEEGNCDYLAKSYSRSINDYNSYKVFSWDGHNEFWNGFVINSDDHYPEDVQNNKDGDRDMWSSTLMCIHDFIGREATDSLVLEHFNYQFSSSIMPDMAQVLLHLDTVLFNHRYYQPIKECLVQRGLADYNLSVREADLLPKALVRNSAAFAAGIGPLRIKSDSEYKMVLYSTLGQELMRFSGKQLELQPEDYIPGLYVIQLDIADKSYFYKILR